MSADRLREAAAKEREEWGDETSRRVYPQASALHLALADLLEHEAERLADHVPVWELGIKRYPESWVGRTVEDNVRHHFGHALTLADLILGGAR